jgi:hypothetical protein
VKELISIFDPILLQDVWKRSLQKKYTIKLKDISFHLNIALRDEIPSWNDDVFRWRPTTPVGLPINHDRL